MHVSSQLDSPERKIVSSRFDSPLCAISFPLDIGFIAECITSKSPPERKKADFEAAQQMRRT